tara:strand:+ start:364 stop:588 length:225 start_codon:yes stop_codon:yes gene_type:complete
MTRISLSTRNCNADKNSSSDTSPFIQYPAVSFIQLGIFSPSASAKLTKSPIVKITNIDEIISFLFVVISKQSRK